MSWISVDERLPEKWDKVIIADIGHSEIYSFTGAIYMGNGYFSAATDGLEAENFDGGACITLDMKPTHWQTLPDPPKQ